ncbi:MAG: NAD(P)(+) transhydrogenase (Re/Si-specific) subunit beta [Oceanicoccus sp.]|uniref:NAD(P)(+) transhydrogenase (Re/Si-specific) subunit beta n=1 Tax=Oceanicoccus sp. TaxID=2691044 RepID=UPI002606B3B7|nr:NAD(P)(+) transhydrogenase (Re/Si-specific) subunit beta [Oceanicoccus sp.]MCP3908645.1 NAD(P)(+) transhydrogenase (Re/Si-specific) subunit beta [Oceanicoccus sp.]MDG1772771.1 NAD(P)(+) transhydrogenase (Re/Si-specific) subunit beta [Oceanicoccus sp.]
MTSLNFDLIINLAYIVSAVLFVFGLKQLSSPATARKGNLMSSVGMLIAIVVTLMNEIKLPWENIIAGLIVGALIGAFAARKVEMTGMPELVAVFNGFGGASSLLVGLVAVYAAANTTFTNITIILSILIGGVTLTGSLIAYGKLSEKMPSKAIQFAGQQVFNGALVLTILASAVMFIQNPSADSEWLYAVIGLSLLFGIMITIPIGGADMPVVIALLNSYSGLAACAAGFVLNNNLLIVSGSLVGASGLILTNIMCKAMNRSLSNVLFSGFGAAKVSSAKIEGEVKPISADDAFLILEAAQNVAIVPGYGMAVAQAQHVVRELSDHLEENGCEVQFAIHPVAGRMPGHMNVLLAEASVSYDQLVEMDDINPQMSNMDVAIVIGANDVVNPAANEDEGSPLYGMPVINVNEARTVFVLKRSMGSGFSGVDNPLFFGDNTRMLFGDAKESISHIVGEFKG